MNRELAEILSDGAARIGTPLSDHQLSSFSTYLNELKKWNKKINLTSLKEDQDIVLKHFLDSLTPLPYVGMGSFLLDMGSGGGLPGIPMKIARPDLRLLLLDSTGKKVSFLNHIISMLKLKNAKALQQRAESSVFQEVMGGHLDVVIARAFGSIDKTINAGAPYLKPGGKLILMKGPRTVDDIENKKRHQAKLKQPDLVHLELPHSGDKRTLLIYEKDK